MSDAQRRMFDARVAYVKAKEERRVASDKMQTAEDEFVMALMERDGLVPGKTRVTQKGETFIFESVDRRFYRMGTNIEPGSYGIHVRKIKKDGTPYKNTTRLWVWADKNWEVV